MGTKGTVALTLLHRRHSRWMYHFVIAMKPGLPTLISSWRIMATAGRNTDPLKRFVFLHALSEKLLGLPIPFVNEPAFLCRHPKPTKSFPYRF